MLCLVENKKIVLVGIPGVGKTTLLSKMVEVIKNHDKSVSVMSFGTLMFEVAKKNGLKDRDELRKLPVTEQQSLQELYLKRLLVGGFEKVYEINRSFRNEGISIKHNPEFTMMELYQAYADYTDMMDITEELISTLVKEVSGGDTITYGDKTINFKGPWKRISFYGALKEKTGVDWQKCDMRKEAKKLNIRLQDDFKETDILNEVFGEVVEKDLIDPTFVIDYPLFMSPLAKQKADSPDLADRFELFVNSMEVANAYSELNDPLEQAKRFKEQAAELGHTDVDEDYCRALSYGMPPAGGLGIGQVPRPIL